MVCRLFGAKQLPELMFTYFLLDHRKQIAVKFESRYYNFIKENDLQNVGHFFLGVIVLNSVVCIDTCVITRNKCKFNQLG